MECETEAIAAAATIIDIYWCSWQANVVVVDDDDWLFNAIGANMTYDQCDQIGRFFAL